MDQQIKRWVSWVTQNAFVQAHCAMRIADRPARLLSLCLGLVMACGAVFLPANGGTAQAQTIYLPGYGADGASATDAQGADAQAAQDNTSPNPPPNIWHLSQAERDAYFYDSGMPAVSPDMPATGANNAQIAGVDAGPVRLFMSHMENWEQLSRRMGYGITIPYRLADLPQASQFRAGWYLDWGVRLNPYRPDGIEFAQMVRVRQDLDCPKFTTRDRTECPYSLTNDGRYTYSIGQSLPQIAEAARRNPGNIWLIGNEMDRRDWSGGGQDEILPELYADAYHDLYHFIKNVDPTARIAIGGIIQPTPLRMQYLTRVWDHYLNKYGTPMPVDIWNTHNFMVEERANGFGADTPPGIGDENTIGEYYYMRDADGNLILDNNGNMIRPPDYSYHINMYYFDRQIRTFRQWMAERGQQEKPLIITEYGALIPNAFMFPAQPHTGLPKYSWDDPTPVVEYMLSTFDYFMNAKDCSIGYVADDCRLVQAWNWYSLNPYGANNPHGALIDPEAGEFTPAGAEFLRYSTDYIQYLSEPYLVPLQMR